MNRGSATLKSALYDTANQENLLLSINVDEDGASGVRLKITGGNGATLADSSLQASDPDAALNAMFAWLEKNNFLAGLAAAGHRIVHGGPKYTDPQRISPQFISEIETLLPLDPDHLPAAIHGIRYIAARVPGLPQVACFDTAFHKELPTVARMYALPPETHEQGIRRYGFHGLSYEYVMSELRALEPSLAGSRVIIAHLGSGASIAAVKQGKSVDTSMGFTPLEGLVMSTRSGDLDPGALIYILETERRSAKGLDALLNKESGLLGASGITGDMRALLEKMPQDAHAAEAVDLFCYRVKKYIGAYAAALGGLDLVVFAGGIGERAPAIREKICEGLDFLGIRLDASSNQSNAATISSQESRVKVRMIKTNEDLMIVRHVLSALRWNS